MVTTKWGVIKEFFEGNDPSDKSTPPRDTKTNQMQSRKQRMLMFKNLKQRIVDITPDSKQKQEATTFNSR